MVVAPVISRAFNAADQAAFGVLSGDTNPLHADPFAARRTQAGDWVVHGAHALLWALDAIFADNPGAASPRSLRVRFERFIYLGEVAVVEVVERGATTLRAEVRAAGVRAIGLTLGFGPRREPQPQPAEPGVIDIGPKARPPLEFALEDLAALRGTVGFARPALETAVAFPRVGAALGPARAAAIATLSRLSGMVCPGLHSITSSYALEFVDGDEDATGIRFATARVAARFRLATISVWGAGIEGTMESFARRPPVAQAAYADMRRTVAADAFAGSDVLVFGGSRGLGEVAAKLAAAGGAATTLTYAVGREDAESVAADIEAGGGVCRVARFDARAPVEPQLGDLAPTHVYYCATPQIFRQRPVAFSPEVLADFTRVYIESFFDVCRLLGARRPLAAFFPSTAFVESPPRDALEYAMAKAAAETLCAGLERAIPDVRVQTRRLPRVSTDQTASVRPSDGADAVEVMLPIVLALQAVRAG